jgi:hypothetical protein
LRRAPGKEKATIYDFVVLLLEAVIATYEQERKLFAAELGRVAEFAGLCSNYAQAFGHVKDVLERYDLTHEFREKDLEVEG